MATAHPTYRFILFDIVILHTLVNMAGMGIVVESIAYTNETQVGFMRRWNVLTFVWILDWCRINDEP